MKHIIFIIISLFLISSCKKEVKIERNLWTHGGKWDIVKSEEIVTSTWPGNVKNEVTENAGIIQFNKDGKGWIITSYYGEAEKANFKYTITETELSLNYYEYSNDGEDNIETYDLDWKKNAFVISQQHTDTYTVYSPNPNGDSLTITDHRTYRYTCEKE